MANIKIKLGLIFYLPISGITQGIFFKNKVLDRFLIVLTVIFIVINVIIVSGSLEAIQSLPEKSEYLTHLVFNSLNVIFGSVVLIFGILPSYQQLHTINSAIYPQSPITFYILEIVRAIFTFRYFCLLLFAILLTIISSQFNFNNLFQLFFLIVFCFHANRSLRTVFCIKLKLFSILYLIVSLLSVISIFVFPGMFQINTISCFLVLFLLSYYSYLELSRKNNKLRNKEELKSNSRDNWILLWLRIIANNSKIVSTITLLLVIKIAFIFIFSTRIFSFIFGFKYFLFISLMPIFLFNYFFNNIFGFTKIIYSNLLLSSKFQYNLFRLYGVLFALVIILDLNASLLCLVAVNFLNASWYSGVSTDPGIMVYIYSLKNILVLYVSFLCVWLPVSMFFSINLSQNIDDKLFSRSSTNVWSALFTLLLAVIYAAVYFSESNIVIYVFASFFAFVGIATALIAKRSLDGEKRLLPYID